jgi:nucleoside-diphosphate-sugar epimerase
MDDMTTLIVGASGATGKLLTEQLLAAGQRVKIIVRSSSTIPDHWHSQALLTIITGSIAEMTEAELSGHVADCRSVAFCLGHNLTWKGIFGKPRNLVEASVRLMCRAIAQNVHQQPVRFVLMNTAGNSNRNLHEPVTAGEGIVLGLLRLFLPPHPDNERAAEHLRVHIGQDHPRVAWVVVRPDSLINEDKVTPYTLHQSPKRSALFNPGKTSRINVAHLMASLITNYKLWNTWKGQMPVVYNGNDQTRPPACD